MINEKFLLEDKQCVIHGSSDAEYILIQPVNEHEMAQLEKEASMIGDRVTEPFVLAAFLVRDWNRELSPWEAPPVFGTEGFGTGAAGTLRFVQESFVPFVVKHYAAASDMPVVLGGYSLAGLFSLWSAYQTDLFAAVAAVSPSVWFPKWDEYAGKHAVQTERIYLSLGKREEKTRNRVMAAVGDRIREQYKQLQEQGIQTTLEWNEGNHFQESDVRCAKAFIWCVRNLGRS